MNDIDIFKKIINTIEHYENSGKEVLKITYPEKDILYFTYINEFRICIITEKEFIMNFIKKYGNDFPVFCDIDPIGDLLGMDIKYDEILITKRKLKLKLLELCC